MPRLSAENIKRLLFAPDRSQVAMDLGPVLLERFYPLDPTGESTINASTIDMAQPRAAQTTYASRITAARVRRISPVLIP